MEKNEYPGIKMVIESHLYSYKKVKEKSVTITCQLDPTLSMYVRSGQFQNTVATKET